MDAEGIWEISVSSAQFCCEKTTLTYTLFFKSTKTKQNMNSTTQTLN